jgi:pimeloyl-ACP methyl ester carboxylesterase/CRP-like cAMP-binding protein
MEVTTPLRPQSQALPETQSALTPMPLSAAGVDISKDLREVTYTVDGVRIHTVQQGQPNRQVALMIHGWSSSWYALSPLMPLVASRFNCIAVDLPGYGQSASLPKRVTIPDYAEIMAHLIDQVTDSPVVLIGHSMGGMTSINLALRFPALIERMVLIGPTISGHLTTSINLLISPITMLERFGLGNLIVASGERLMVGLTDRLMRPVSFSGRTDIAEVDYRRLRADARRPGQGRVRAECYFAMRENDLTSQLGLVETPALVLWGAEDNTVPLRDSGLVADEWPAADLRIIPKAGHWPQFERADVTRRYVAAYLGLPLTSGDLNRAVDDEDLAVTREAAQFMAHSAVGNNLNEAQRLRLAAQFDRRLCLPGEVIVRQSDSGNEMYVVQTGAVQVWSDPEAVGQPPKALRHIATLLPGQIAGELAMLDSGLRTADLRAGPEGATLLVLNRERLQGLCEDDPALGTRVLWNISKAMSGRVRFVLYQLQRALHKMAASQSAEAPEAAPQE